MASLKDCLRLKVISEGDLVAVSRTGFFSRLIRRWTRETYSHVAIVYSINGVRVKIVEASDKKGIRFSAINKLLPAYVFYIKDGLTSETRDFINSKIGQKYSWFDCLRAAFHCKPRHDDKWQCAEFANAVLRKGGFLVDEKAITPGKLVKEVLKKGSGRAVYIDKKK